MSKTYFTKQPELLVAIPAAFDKQVVAATLAELVAWDGPWPSFTDAASVRVAIDHVQDDEQAKTLRKYTERSPSLHIEFLRALPAKFFTSSVVNQFDAATMAFARLRKLKLKFADSIAGFELRDELAHLTDAEIDAFIKAMIADEKRSVTFSSEPVARRLVARLSEAHLTALWARLTGDDLHFLRALSDAQVHALVAGVIAGKSTAPQLIYIAIQRGILTLDSLAAYLQIVENDRFSPDAWARDPRGASPADEAASRQRFHRNVVALVEPLRAWLSKNAPKRLGPSLLRNEQMMLLVAVTWNPEVQTLASPHFAASAADLKDRQLETVRAIVNALMGSAHEGAVLAALDGAKGGETMSAVIAEARSKLADSRALLAGSETIGWGHTDHERARQLLATFKDPAAAIAAGLVSDDPVAVLNAWTVDPRSLTSEQHLAALARLEKLYTPEAPDGAALERLIGHGESLPRRFDRGFTAARETDQSGRVWKAAGELYRGSNNARFKDWLRPYLDDQDASLVEPVATQLARLIAECAKEAELAETVERTVIVRTARAPAKTTVNRMFGEPIGVDAKRWPKKGKKKLEHVITLEASVLSAIARASLGEGVAAIAVFVDSIDKGFESAAIVSISSAQLPKATKAKATPGEASREHGVALEAIKVQVPERVFQDGKKAGPLFELRKLFDRMELVPGDGPHWLQEPEDVDDFLFELGHSFAPELNLGDAGRMYVFADTALYQSK